MSFRKYVPLATAVMLMLAATPAAAVNGLNNEGMGPISRAMGGGGVSYNIGTAGSMVNPATLGLIPLENGKSQLEVGLFDVFMDISATNLATGESANTRLDSPSNSIYVPEGGFAHRWNDLTLSVGIYSQGGLAADYGAASFLSRLPSGVDTGLENSAKLFAVRAPFALSYQVSDKLIVGGSVDAVYTGLSLNILFGANQVGAAAAAGRVTGALASGLGAIFPTGGIHISTDKSCDFCTGARGFGVGGKIGFVYQATADTSIGAVYQTPTTPMDLEGRAAVTALTPAGAPALFQGEFVVQDFVLPAQVAVGFSHQFNDKFMVVSDLSYVFWKQALGDLKLRFVNDANAADLNVRLLQQWDDIMVLSLGAQYKPWPDLALRAGVSISSNPIPAAQTFALIPLTTRDHVGTGATYSINEDLDLNFSYAHTFNSSVINRDLPNSITPINSSASADTFYLGVRFGF